MMTSILNHRRPLVCVLVGIAISPLLTSVQLQAQDYNELDRQSSYLLRAGRYFEAEKVLKRQLAVAQGNVAIVDTLNGLGWCYTDLEINDEAQRHYIRAMAIEIPKDRWNRFWIPNNLANTYIHEERWAEADKYFEYALRLAREITSADSEQVATVLGNYGISKYKQDQLAEADRMLQEARAIKERKFGTDSSQLSNVYNNIGRVRRKQKNYAEAEAYIKKAIALREKWDGPEHSFISPHLYYLSEVMREQEKYAEAEALDRRAVSISEAAYGKDHKFTAEKMESLATDLEHLDRKSEAEEIRKRVAAINGDKIRKRNRLEILSAKANVNDGPKVLASVRQGQRYTFTKVNGPHYCIDITINGERKQGWIRDVDFVLVHNEEGNAPVENPVAVKWNELAPPGGGFSIQVPGAARPETPTLNGVTAQNFVANSPHLKFEVLYFTVPSDRTLTFESGIAALSTRKGGKLLSQKNIEIDLYPGREVVIQFPDSHTRMRIYSIGRKWFVLNAEGGDSHINSDDANRFFASFQLKS